MSRRGFYIYENMDSWQRFNETSLPNKKEFYSNLSVEDIADSDFKHNMLQMVEKGTRGEMCHTVHWYGKANNKYMKD